MRHTARSIIAALVLTLVSHDIGWSLGLAARFGEVVVENAEIGRTYNLRETLRIPLGIENRSGSDTTVTIEFEAPQPKFIKENYEAIPDPSWLRSIPEQMVIGPKSQGFFDLLLTIPNDPKLNGKHYQAVIKARTVGTGLLGVAIENTLRFSIGPGPDTLKEEKRQKAMAKLDFDVSPQVIYVVDVPIGQRFDAKKEQNKSIRVANYAVDPLPIQLMSEPWDKLLYLPTGYEPIPDPKWITFKNNSADIDPESIEQFQIVIEVPNDEKYRGKSYAAFIRTGLKTGFWLDAPVRLYFTTK